MHEFFPKIAPAVNPLPKHLALIPDGNCRWAKAHGVSTVEGYQAGFRALEAVAVHADALGISFMTVYLASTENLTRRSARWKREFFCFAGQALQNSLGNEFLQRVRLRCIGDLSLLPTSLQTELQRLVEQTKENPGMLLNLAVGYSGRDEIVEAVDALVQARLKAPQSAESRQHVTEQELEKYLELCRVPAPDLLIRTSGEMRLSGFLLWHLAYTELAFASELWPDFSVEHFDSILREYQGRQRNFGAESSKE